MLTLEQRAAFVQEAPDLFLPIETGGKKRAPVVRLRNIG